MSKRLFDLLFSFFGLVVLSPVLILVILYLRLFDRGPVFFLQTRVGRDGKNFQIIKFRTMVVDAQKQGGAITIDNDQRITPIGKILRKYKLDELPQLVNVLKGEMSFVGPRPEVPEYVNLYTQEQKRVLEVRPGITDPASIKYRHEAQFLKAAEDPRQKYIQEIMPDKIKINLEYQSQASLFSDIRVIIKTLVAI